MVPQVPATMDLPKKDAVDHYKKTHTRKITAFDTLFTSTMDIFKSLTDNDFAYNNSILDLEKIKDTLYVSSHIPSPFQHHQVPSALHFGSPTMGP